MKYTNRYILYALIGALCVYGAIESAEEIDMQWQKCSPKASPTPRYAHAMAYDASRKVTVLFGGAADGGPTSAPAAQFLQDTWEWDGKNWTKKSPQGKPGPRYGHAMAYDSARKKIILFGGFHNKLGNFNDTWEYDGTTWKRKSPADKPTPRDGHAMAYDAARDRIVLFGGLDAARKDSLDDTWEYDGTNWKLIATATKPTGRRLHAMVYDASRKVTVLVCGYKDKGQLCLRDTWEWDGKDWKSKLSETQPQARECHGLAYYSARGRCVVFGGWNPTNGTLNDTWEYDGSVWTAYDSTVVMPPTAREYICLAYDSARRKVVLFGGYARDLSPPQLDETWEYGSK